MREPSFYVSGLLDLHELKTAGEVRATWRQSMAALARAASEDGPRPLDGIHPEALAKGVRAALAHGLVDDLDWLAPPAAGCALYELASALPLGPEQRELGRRVLSRLLAGNAEAFVALATRMALGSGKALGAPATRSRVALATELPIQLGIADGALAFALASRRELAREWFAVPSTGSLSSRRLVARLLERAAREAARRAQQGDEHALRVFKSETVQEAYFRLLADREPLVWRHVAVARGLLATWVPELRQQIESGLSPTLSPTEWRRSATSLAAQVAVSPDSAMRIAMLAISQGVIQRDPGIALALVWGSARGAEGEPEAAAELLEKVIATYVNAELAEAIAELRTEFGATALVEKASALALAELRKKTHPERDDGAEALARDVARDLERAPRDDEPVREQLHDALLKFATEGAKSAYAAARGVLDAAKGALDALEAVSNEGESGEGRGGSMARRASLAVLRDLDISVLERNTLADLLRLGANASETARAKSQEEELDTVRERLSAWILARESGPLWAPIGGGGARDSKSPVLPSHPTLRRRRLRALVHLVDCDVGDPNDDAQRAARLRHRWLRVAKALTLRFERDPPSVLRRTILAALARSIDAVVRGGAGEVTDVLLVVARHVEDPLEFETLAEASMDPDLVHALSRYAVFLNVVSQATELGAKLAALEDLASNLTTDGSGRAEAMRSVLVRLHSAMLAMASARSLRQLASDDRSEADTVASFETALASLAQLAAAARGRLDPERTYSNSQPAMTRPLSVVVSRILSGLDTSLSEHGIAASVDSLLAGIPKSIARIASLVIWRLADLELEAPSTPPDSTALRVQELLPAWLPARRTLGGYYILRSLGSGAVGSVFIANRLEDRNDANAERFALKVPDYSATAARSISEAEFHALFRSEASALMAVPAHKNLARFVTFDAGARPKPILVMELVEGVTLERCIEKRMLDVSRALRILDEVLAGLDAMHSVGVGHLDLKPSNVVLRKGEQAVLVDFGLAGRHIRPGCATGPYGSPEVWGALGPEEVATPMMADVYAFGCLAFEMLTGRVLFGAESELAQVAMHVAHDGRPPAIDRLGESDGLAPLADVLASTLRRSPSKRVRVGDLRDALRRIAPKLATRPWPLVD